MKAPSTPKKKSMGKKVGHEDKIFAESLRDVWEQKCKKDYGKTICYEKSL